VFRVARMRRFAAGIAAVGILSFSGTVTAAPAAAVSPSSTFDFCNETGGTIACFYAHMEFLSRYEFQMWGISLYDGVCDNRSALAFVLSNAQGWKAGSLGGLNYTWKNSSGCYHYIFPSNRIFEASGAVQYVEVAAYGANLNGHSSITWSLKHYNPYY
jgi:hypothetical protein